MFLPVDLNCIVLWENVIIVPVVFIVSRLFDYDNLASMIKIDCVGP